MQKGISPLIAAVLLIAATMSIAGILAYWASNFVRTALPETNSSQTTCQFADFQISSCNYANDTISFVLYNYRTIPLTGMTATIFDNNNLPAWINVTLVPTSPAGTNNNLPVGQYYGYQIPNIPSNFTKIIITSTMCPALTHESACRG